jgi:hypothetical protein
MITGNNFCLVNGSGSVISIGYDDNLRSIDANSRQYAGAAISLSAQPRALEVKGDLTFVATLQVPVPVI